MAVTYEWDVEELEDAPSVANGFDPDILDHHFCDSYAEAVSKASTMDGPHRIVLVRDVGNDLDGLTDRAWSYLKEDGALPETFAYHGSDHDSGIAVPKRFHREVATAGR